MVTDLVLFSTLLSLPLLPAVQISYKDICGNKLHDSCPDAVNTKIVGGTSTCAEKVPWNVLVENIKEKSTRDGGQVSPYCGGSLVTARHVLSAAHCYWTNENIHGQCPEEFLLKTPQDCRGDRCPASCTRLGPEDVRLHLGLTKRSLVEAGSGARVDRISIHPDWDKKDRLNDIFAGHDIAVLRLESDVSSYTSRVVPICLPRPARESYLLRENSVVDVTGFGVKITRKGTLVFPNTVQTARVTVMDTETCRSFWPLMTGNQICAIGTEVSQTNEGGGQLVQDSCNGDSGGGLTATNFNGREVLLGIISFGEPDCGRRGGKPGVYTNVMDQLEWIQRQISSETSSSEGTCRSDNGKACVFPFTFRNQKFRGCTQEFDDSNTAWCSTKTVNGEHIAGEGEWGYCLSGCPVDSPPVTESPWSACSATCGGGTQTRSDGSQTRRCNRTPCPPAASWSAWSACSFTCGGGTQTRRRGGVRDSRRCNTGPCPAAGVEVASEYWLVGGTQAADHIERIKERGGGQVCSSSISVFPNSYSSQMGGFLSGRVVVCGGNSGTDSITGKYRVHGDCYSANPARPGDWTSVASMKINTTNAAYTVYRDKLYVLGGYQKPACGYRPGVQVYSPSTNSWSVNTKRDPPRPLGAYSCAVTAGNKIFVIGGWYPFNHLPGADTCKEDLSASELTAVNNEYDYYQEYVQIYEPDTNTWTQGPSLVQRRRKHGCALVELNGKKGIMVAGGFNSRDGTLSTVEYLELGQDLNSLGSLRGARWNQLTSMRFPRRGKPLLLEGRDDVLVVGGEISSGDNTIQRFSKITQRWDSIGFNTRRKRFDSTYVELPQFSTGC